MRAFTAAAPCSGLSGAGVRAWSGLFGAVRDAPVDVPAVMLGRAAGGLPALADERRSPNNPAIPPRRGCRAGSCRGGVA